MNAFEVGHETSQNPIAQFKKFATLPLEQDCLLIYESMVGALAEKHLLAVQKGCQVVAQGPESSAPMVAIAIAHADSTT